MEGRPATGTRDGPRRYPSPPPPPAESPGRRRPSGGSSSLGGGQRTRRVAPFTGSGPTRSPGPAGSRHRIEETRNWRPLSCGAGVTLRDEIRPRRCTRYTGSRFTFYRERVFEFFITLKLPSFVSPPREDLPRDALTCPGNSGTSIGTEDLILGGVSRRWTRSPSGKKGTRGTHESGPGTRSTPTRVSPSPSRDV